MVRTKSKKTLFMLLKDTKYMKFEVTDIKPAKKPLKHVKTKGTKVSKQQPQPKQEKKMIKTFIKDEDIPFPTTIDLSKHIKMIPKPDSKIHLSKDSLKMIRENEDLDMFNSISNVLETGDKELGVDELRKQQAAQPKFTGLPGWGNWANTKTINNTNLVATPKIRKEEQKKKRVFIKEDANKNDHQVTDVPFPFTSVKDYESSIRLNFSQEFAPRRSHNLLARTKKKVDLELEEH